VVANVQKRNMHCIGWEKKTPGRKKKERTTTIVDGGYDDDGEEDGSFL